ncbi:MAG TPA: MFS transporter [Thermoanaerobaculia bacterium]|nr:MFS transporter [Thermoanaerobaculia bacterium]
MPRPPDRNALTILAAAHAVNDAYQSAVPALLPFLVAERGLTYAAAGGLVLAGSAVSSFLQPLLGAASDRRALPFLMPLGILLAGAGIAAATLAPGYALTAAAVLVSGAGVAVFHPEAARHANYASGEKRATGMSIFSVGGNLGIALGPAAVTVLASAGGVRGVAWMAVPAVLAAVLLTRELPRLAAFRPQAEAVLAASPAPARWGAFLSLSTIITIRSMMSFGLTAFIPLWLVSARGVPRSRAALALTVMLLAGAGATLVGGRLADRFGRRRVLVGSLLPLAPLIALTLATRGPAVLVPLALTGAFSIASYSVGVVMGQEYLPGREGIAGGVTMGLAIGLGGAGVPLLGLVADHWGVASVFGPIAALPLIAAVLALTLPGRPLFRRAVPTAA